MKSSVLLEIDSVYIMKYAKWFLSGNRAGFIKVIAEWAKRDILEIFMYDPLNKIQS